MPKKEPQSYGSQTPPPEHQVFYENLHEARSGATKNPTQKVPDKEGGAKRGSFFKDRDYK